MDINVNNGGNKMCLLFLAFKWMCSDSLLLIRCLISIIAVILDRVKYNFFVNFLIFLLQQSKSIAELKCWRWGSSLT